MTFTMHQTGIPILLAVLIAAMPHCSSAQGTMDCPNFNFPNSAFPVIARNYEPAVLYVRIGPKGAGTHGVGFLIETSPPYFLTARHVVQQALSNPSITITGINSKHRTLALKVIADDLDLDVALLQVVPENRNENVTDGMQQDGAHPYELFFSPIQEQDVTFSGLATASEEDVRQPAPHEDRFQYNDNASLLKLRIATGDGDSGAPVYNIQGLVVGIVQKRQGVIQGTAVALRSLASFVTRHAMTVPTESPIWKLREFLLTNSNRASLIDKLMPGSGSGVTNFQLLGAMKLILDRGEFPRVNRDFIQCPLSDAAVERGLLFVARDWEFAGAETKSGDPLILPKSTEPKSQPSGDRTDLEHAELVGDELLARATYWDTKGQSDFYRLLSADAQAKFRDAIIAYLKVDKRPVFALMTDKTNPRPAEQALSRLGIFTAVNLADFDSSRRIDTPLDDKFAGLLNKYYQASVGAQARHVFGPQHYLPGGAGLEDEENKTAARNTTAAWATLLSDSASQRAKSWSLLGDAMLIAGQPDEAARSLADVHRIQPKDDRVLQNYEIAKEQQTLRPFGHVISAATIIGRERPLTREDLQKIAVAPARPQPSEPVKAANTPKGEVLVDAKAGMTLYVFDRNSTHSGVGYDCDRQCESNWPPLIAADGAKPSGVWTFTVREDGKKQWAYKGKPLYFSKSDAKAGDVAGDRVGGNIWHPAAP